MRRNAAGMGERLPIPLNALQRLCRCQDCVHMAFQADIAQVLAISPAPSIRKVLRITPI